MKLHASPSSSRHSNIPITIPVAVRTTSDYGLRFTVSDITQLTPLASAANHVLGLSRRKQP